MVPRPENDRKKILRHLMNFLPEKELKLKKRIFLLNKRILFDQSNENVKDNLLSSFVCYCLSYETFFFVANTAE